MKQHTLTIPVTEEIIAAASRADSHRCMIADAIERALPNVRNVSVDVVTIRFSDRDRGQRYVYITPDLARQQLLRFDDGVVVEPWTLRLPSRPAQIIPIVANASNPNRLKRPTNVGPKAVSRDKGAPVRGGVAPPLGVLAHSTSSHPGRMRLFGIKDRGKFETSRES